MPLTLDQKIYNYSWPKDSIRRGQIIFMRVDNIFTFSDCRFCGVHSIYDLDDWTFLRDLAEEILSLSITEKEK